MMSTHDNELRPGRSSLKIVSNELAILLNMNLKYLSTKKDKYENDISQFAIENIDFNEIIKDLPEKLKMPQWAGKDGFVLKVKNRHLEEKDKSKGVATITLKKYDYEQFIVYFVTKVAFNA